MKKTFCIAVILFCATICQLAWAEKNPSGHAERNIKALISALKSNYSITARHKLMEVSYHCFSDTHCETYVGSNQVMAMGYMVDAMSSSKTSPEQYLKLCSALVIGLGVVNKDLAESVVVQTFEEASASGRSKHDIGGVGLQVSAGSDDQLTCKAVRYP